MLQRRVPDNNPALPATQLPMSTINSDDQKLAACISIGAGNSGTRRFAAISPPGEDVIRLLTADNRSWPMSSRTDWVSWSEPGVRRKRNPKLICLGTYLIHYQPS
jgi:hypothetical protein